MKLAAHSSLQKKPLVEPTSASNAHPQRTQVIRQQMHRDRFPAASLPTAQSPAVLESRSRPT